MALSPGIWKGNKDSAHCSTCGLNYTPEFMMDDEGERQLHTHECPLPQGPFFVEERREYEYRDGKLYSRLVRFMKYSGHNTQSGRRVLGEWREYPAVQWSMLHGDVGVRE